MPYGDGYHMHHAIYWRHERANAHALHKLLIDGGYDAYIEEGGRRLDTVVVRWVEVLP